MTTEEQIRAIKQELRSAMNGELSARMRRAGMPYKLVFGVELPRLQNIASEFTPDRHLAQQLWHEPIRECKMLAALLMPPDEMLAEVADIWIDEMLTSEVAQVCCMYLFSRTRWASEQAFHWIASEHPMRQLCGFLIIARLLQQGARLNERAEQEIADQAETLLPDADLQLAKAIRAVQDKIAAQNYEI